MITWKPPALRLDKVKVTKFLSSTLTIEEPVVFLIFFQAVPPLEITDPIEELRDGHVLLSLLEVLLGKTLVRSSNWLNGSA